MTKQHKEQRGLSERNNGSGSSRQPSPGGDKQREQTAKSSLALGACVVGIFLGLVDRVTTFFTGPATTADVSIQAVGILLGI